MSYNCMEPEADETLSALRIQRPDVIDAISPMGSLK